MCSEQGDRIEDVDKYRRRRYFAEAGVEKESGATGLAYGSHSFDRDSSWHGHKLDNRTSAERKKLKLQQKEIEQDHRTFLEVREQQRKDRVVEQRKDLNELRQYNPWGKPAGGAPRVAPNGYTEARMTGFQAGSDFGSDYYPYGRPGGGAPLKSKSGKLATGIKDARDIRFQDHLRREVDSLRYKADLQESNQASEPEVENPVTRTESENVRLLEDRDRRVTYGRKLDDQRREAVERRARERKEAQAAPHEFIWGKNKVARDKSGKLFPRAQALKEDSCSNSLVSQMRRAPLVDNIKPGGEVFDPWGRPGGGAPLRDDQGQVVATGVLGKHCKPLEKKSSHSIATVDRSRAARDYGIDMATWMRSRDVGKPPNYKQPADAEVAPVESKADGYCTELQAEAQQRHKVQEQRRMEERDYHSYLTRAVEERALQRKQSNETKLALERKHVAVFNNSWGRPGAGAPRYNSQGEVDTLPKNMSSLETQVHTGRHFRNT